MSDGQRHTKTYNILPGPKMGLITPEYLEAVAAAVRQHDIPLLKITSAQRLAIGGHSPETATEIWRSLGLPDGPQKPAGVHYIQACPGSQWCKYGQQDSLELGRKMDSAVMAVKLPAKTKFGLSGCGMNCCECYVRDVGLFGKKNGWTLIFGGNGGGRPRIGDVIARDLSDEQAVELAQACLKHYASQAKPRERTARFMERTGVEAFKRAVLGA
ncbi:Nitrite/Sulfite reductase ferredoxin-like half domain-containing protein [Desulfonatronum thiosulfatophilum]|uniref:Nitrite/Sulfite reductase ferredoxin-like half domain-containing protein n=1 Tax=Desulfonatronum thiosulfatophilum TaxID=617002 RepID=A0A1G6EQP8_9BACT|nr:sulfite reductase, assimilatory-type [Desulfonatronum thiosulfatophilum]SDB59676.1 Nitrite/Sulfite reductase ferredoxin-like half domain-containing protein [Desulfonatronum thiosulfatophilum]